MRLFSYIWLGVCGVRECMEGILGFSWVFPVFIAASLALNFIHNSGVFAVLCDKLNFYLCYKESWLKILENIQHIKKNKAFVR